MIFDEKDEIEKIYIMGNAVIIYKDIILKTNKAVFDRKKNLIECEDGVEIFSEFGSFYAEKARYNLIEEKGVIFNSKFNFNSIYGRSEKIEREGGFFKFENGYVTTCDREEKPHYRLKAGKIEYWQKKDYLRLKKVRIVFGEDFNIFYLPVFSFDLKTKKPFFTPSLEYKTRTGPSLIFNFTNRISEKNDYLFTEKVSIGEKGSGIGLGFSSQEKNIDFNSFFIKKYDGGILSGGYLEFNRNFGDFHILVDWRWMDNNEFFIDYFKDQYMEKSKVFNYFSITKNFGKSILGLTIRENAKEDILKVEQIPEIRYFVPYFNFSEKPVFLIYDFRFTNFYKESEFYPRILNKLDIEYKKDFSYLTMKPIISFSSLNYPDCDLYKFNYILEQGINFSTNFYSKFFDGNITFIPSFYIFNRKTKYSPEQLIKFDEFEEKNSGNFLYSSFLWNINQYKDLIGNFQVENEFNLDKNKFEKFFNKYELVKGRFKIEGENEWDLKDGDIVYNFGVNTISYETQTDKFSIGTRMDKESDISGLETWWQKSFENGWNYRIGFFYDFDSKEILTQTYEIWKKIHCLTLSFRFTKDRENKSFYVFIIPTLFFENNWQRRFEKWK
ncbi:MAG: hypothetical protein NC899_05530 [Candidatus Omnitrophica bacterium]|nr:hypothetical protein [Candidatus Omnitrophota bacterium]